MQTTSESSTFEQGMMGNTIRPMRSGDIPQVATIERECFPSSLSSPFQRELATRWSRYLVVMDLGEAVATPSYAPTLTLAPETGFQRFMTPVKWLLGQRSEPPITATLEYLVGFLGLWFMVDEAHIVSIGVRESHRGRGVGELLLIASIELALENISRMVTLEVRRSNTVAQRLYEKYGFANVGLRKGYYSDNREDAIIMTTDELTSPSFVARFRGLVEQHSLRWGTSQRDLG